MLIPLKANVPADRPPWANAAIIAATVIISIWALNDHGVLWSLAGFREDFRQTQPLLLSALTSTLVHGGVLHLLGNMLFLWIFGGAMNYKFGHLGYLGLYVFSAVVAGMAHYALRGGPAVGASGAINGVMGAFLVFFPTNKVTVLWIPHILLLQFSRPAHITGIWLILFWLAWDVLMILLGGGRVAYWAHVGGFIAGFAVAMLLAATGWVKPTEGEETLLEVFGVGR
jgi:membrane associated rhomboid family serine protease